MKALLTTITNTLVTRREPSSRRSPQGNAAPTTSAPLPLSLLTHEFSVILMGRHTLFRQWCKAIASLKYAQRGPSSLKGQRMTQRE